MNLCGTLGENFGAEECRPLGGCRSGLGSMDRVGNVR